MHTLSFAILIAGMEVAVAIRPPTEDDIYTVLVYRALLYIGMFASMLRGK